LGANVAQHAGQPRAGSRLARLTWSALGESLVAKVVTFLGTRPEIIKLSPLIPLLAQNFEHVLIHSGQHYTRELEGVLFEELGLSQPQYNLQAGSGPQARQVARMMIGLEEILLEQRPDALIVLGGANTALAGALTSVKLGIRVAHVEAGLRTFNTRMPEEINRILIDRISGWLFAPDEIAREHLLSEGVDDRNVHVVGSTTVDACRRNLRLAEARPLPSAQTLTARQYVVLTLHRAENTEQATLDEIVTTVNALSRIWPVVFPVHPRTRQQLGDANPFGPNVELTSPLGYLDMLNLILHARALLTDSSSLQEEAVVLGTPALVMRNETEWPRLIDIGANALVGNTYRSLMDRAWPIIASDAALEAMRNRAVSLPGGAAMRIARTLRDELTPGARSRSTASHAAHDTPLEPAGAQSTH
jgi:UDP-N-acetylglucosamine 2-epimerase (non-hydrolysing)